VQHRQLGSNLAYSRMNYVSSKQGRSARYIALAVVRRWSCHPPVDRNWGLIVSHACLERKAVTVGSRNSTVESYNRDIGYDRRLLGLRYESSRSRNKQIISKRSLLLVPPEQTLSGHRLVGL